jgi:small GTP-binding protein
MIVDGRDVIFQYKIVLLGDSRVGKTSLITRQVHELTPGTPKPTLGCHCNELSFTIDQKQICLQVWDTAGQEMYRALVPVYLRGANCALLLYDVLDQQSFDSLGHWYSLLDDVVMEAIPVFLVANKIDLIEHVVKEQSAVQFAQTHKAKFFRVSALTGDGVDHMFEEIARDVSKSNLSNRIRAGVVQGPPAQGCGC